MAKFYIYTPEPEILKSYSEYSNKINGELVAVVDNLQAISAFTYFFRRLFNGRHFQEKVVVSNTDEACKALLTRLKSDYHWAQKQGYKIEIRICKYDENPYSMHLFLAMKDIEAPDTYGWILMEQIVIKKPNVFEIWRHEDEEDDESDDEADSE